MNWSKSPIDLALAVPDTVTCPSQRKEKGTSGIRRRESLRDSEKSLGFDEGTQTDMYQHKAKAKDSRTFLSPQSWYKFCCREQRGSLEENILGPFFFSKEDKIVSEIILFFLSYKNRKNGKPETWFLKCVGISHKNNNKNIYFKGPATICNIHQGPIFNLLTLIMYLSDFLISDHLKMISFIYLLWNNYSALGAHTTKI